MWTTFSVILVFLSFLAAALQSRAENDNFTQDILFEEYGRQTTLVARNPSTGDGTFSGPVDNFRPVGRPQPAQPHDTVVVKLEKTWESHHRFASVDIGNQKVHRFVVHTDSPCFWVKHYNPQSTTHEGEKTALKTCDSRIDGAQTVSGHVHQDQITVGEMKEDGRVLRVEHGRTDYNGEIGLALPGTARSVAEQMTFFHDFIKKRFPEPIFALHLKPGGGELHIGKPIVAYYATNIEYHVVTKTTSSWQRWQIGPAVIGINEDEMVLSEKKSSLVPKRSKMVQQKIETVFDSTRPYIYGPPQQVKKIYEAIRGRDDGEMSGHAYPCHTQVKVHFKWGNGQKWFLGPRRFKTGEIPGFCEGIIRSDPNVVGGPWTIGYSYMEDMSLVFHWTPDHAFVGIALSASLPMDPPAYEDGPPNYVSRSGSGEPGAKEKGIKGA